MMTVYSSPNTRSIRVIWVLEEIGVSAEIKSMPYPPRQHAPDYFAVNPTGMVPLLIDGEVRLGKSMAICDYLAAKHGSPLVVSPDDPERPQFLQWLWYGKSTLMTPLSRLNIVRQVERKTPEVELTNGCARGRPTGAPSRSPQVWRASFFSGGERRGDRARGDGVAAVGEVHHRIVGVDVAADILLLEGREGVERGQTRLGRAAKHFRQRLVLPGGGLGIEEHPLLGQGHHQGIGALALHQAREPVHQAAGHDEGIDTRADLAAIPELLHPQTVHDPVEQVRVAENVPRRLISDERPATCTGTLRSARPSPSGTK